MSESGPGKPIPNDDPECRCLLLGEADAAPAGFTVLRCATPDEETPLTWVMTPVRVAYDPACPHHGPAVKSLQRSALKSFSTGTVG